MNPLTLTGLAGLADLFAPSPVARASEPATDPTAFVGAVTNIVDALATGGLAAAAGAGSIAGCLA